MDYVKKLLKRISIKAILVHTIALAASLGVIWGVSYLILVTFSIQDNTTVPATVVQMTASSTATSTLKNIKKGTGHATSTGSSTKAKK